VNASPLDDSILGLTAANVGDVYTLSVAIADGTGPAHVIVNLPYGTGAGDAATGSLVAVVGGITTNIAYLRRILELPDFVAGDYDTSLLARHHQTLLAPVEDGLDDVALMAAAIHRHERDARPGLQSGPTHTSDASDWRRVGRSAVLRRADF
jgi:hypothetical protein